VARAAITQRKFRTKLVVQSICEQLYIATWYKHHSCDFSDCQEDTVAGTSDALVDSEKERSAVRKLLSHFAFE